MQHHLSLLSIEDFRFLRLVVSRRDEYPMDRDALRMLQQKLEDAEPVPAEEIPPDVITMNSRVHLRNLNDDELMIRTLVYPGDAAAGGNRLSVLAPLGMAILGRRVGELIEWPVPSGLARIRIVKITYQPEAKLRRSASSA